MNKKKTDQPSQAELMNTFRKKYTNFKDLLGSNGELLKIISIMEEKLSGQYLFGMSYIRSDMVRVVFHAARMIGSFEALSDRKYPELSDTLNRINNEINQELELKNVPRGLDFVVPYDGVAMDCVDFVGGKNANLGEIKSNVRLPIPNGFAITTTAFDEFMAYNDLYDEISTLISDIDSADPESLIRVSSDIQLLFNNAVVPPAIEMAILNSYEKEISSDGSVHVAMRSSAIGEDSELSFAGQYQSFLNVPKKDIINKYKEVIASLFTPRAITYRKHMGIPFEDVAMCVACLEMIDAESGGVMYTRHPFNLLRSNIIINSTWGLGALVVDGSVSPDTFEFSKDTPPVLLSVSVMPKKKKLSSTAEGDVYEFDVDATVQNKASLTEEQAAELADCALKLEKHFQTPQDIEWVTDRNGRIVILQARPLRVEVKRGEMTLTERFDSYPILLEAGSIACPGVGYGPAHLVYSEDDLLTFPEGGVLVASHSSPGYVVVMEKARAIVTNAGSIMGHMASMSREFDVPTLLNTKTATSVIQQGAYVTVDAFAGRVYDGKVDELLNMERERGAFMKNTPVYQTLQKLAKHIVPLNLTNPKSRHFTAKKCATIHDIMRFAHEMSYTEVFKISDIMSERGSISKKFDAPLPIDLYVIDLGGGLEDAAHRSRITRDHVVSVPFNALLSGMLHNDLCSTEPRPVNIRGFLSVMSQQMMAPPNKMDERFGDRSYIIISDEYINFSSRVGYHYSILDSYCGPAAIKNYINFQFKGGAADDVRRNRRARLIKSILESDDFLVDVQGDRVYARYVKHESHEIEQKLELLGKLLIYTRQMDMLMNTEKSVDILSSHFLGGKYNLNDVKILHKMV